MTDETTEIRERGPFAPVLLLALALLILLGFQTLQLLTEGATLRETKANQEKPLENALAARAQLEGLAADTARLAEQGNANAERMIEQLRKRGVTVSAETATESGD
jgi:F0F1-type ATP synthase membrane subunit b/b'